MRGRPTRTCPPCSTSRRRSPRARPRSSRTARTTSSTRATTAAGSASATSTRAFEEADHVFEWRYQSSPIEHAPTETTGCIVVPQADGRLRIHSDTQACFFTLDNTALILDVPFGKLRVVGGTVGGGFGGKVDVMVEPIACIAAMATNKPVKYVYGREEEMQVSSPRAAERIYIKDGVMADGTIVARKVTLYVDAGAYSRHSPYGTTKAAAHMPGPYTIPNVWVDAHCVYTNRTPSSAMRGFGVTIADYALESQMDRIARALDLDPLQLRLKNAYRDGDMKAHRKRAEGTALIEVIQRAADLVGHDLPDEYRRCRRRRRGDGEAARTRLRRGQLPDRHEPGRRPVAGADPLDHDRHFVVTLSSVDLGQGIKTIAAQCAAETLGLPFENILVDTADTDTGPHCMGTFASRGTHRVGNAVIMAAREAREVMLQVAADELEVDPADLETDGTGFIKLKGSEEKKIHIVDLALAAHFKQGARSPAAASSSRRRPSRCPRRARWTPTPARRTPARSPRSRSTTRPASSRCSRCTTSTRSAARSTRRWRRSRSRAAPGWASRTRCSRRPSPTTPSATHGPTDFSEYLMPGPGRQRGDAERDPRAPGRRTARSARRASAR